MPLKKRRSDCPISTALDIFGDKWTLLIIRDMMFKGKCYYGEFLASEENIATNILADRLMLLEQSGVITKNPDPEQGAKYIYRLSDKGIDLLPVLVEVILWSAKYDTGTAADRQFLEQALSDKPGLIRKIIKDIRSQHCQ